ncbi:MAG: hypothetical protein M0R03_08185 [Novosphingobium sp.]|nr:hypothetical protein [Novosphingobium sp.]
MAIKDNNITRILQDSIQIPKAFIRVWDTKSASNYFDSRAQINDILNPSFENWTSGNPDNWTFSKNIEDNSHPLNDISVSQSSEKVYGLYSLEFDLDYKSWDDMSITWDDNNFTWNGDGYAEVTQIFDYNYEEFSFGVYAKGQGYVALRAYDIDDNVVSDNIVAFSSTSYVKVSNTFHKPENVAYFEIALGTQAGSSGVLFDGAFVARNSTYQFENFNTISYDEFDIENFTISSKINETNSATIYVPMENRISYNGSGFGIIDKMNIVEIFCGFRDTTYDVDRMILKFVGFINIVSEGSDNKLQVICDDFSQCFKMAMNEGYPDYDSYMDMPDDSGFDRYRDSITRDNYIPAYDNWLLENAIRDLCIKAEFPVDYSNIFKTNVRLPIGVDNYPFVSKDDEGSLAYEFGYGDRIWDIIKKLAESFGYYVGFSNDGKFEFLPIGNWEFKKPNSMVYSEEFDFIGNDFSSDNPTWTYITNQSNIDSGTIIIENIEGQNLRLYTLADKSSGTISASIFKLTSDGDIIETVIGDFDVKGTMDDSSPITANYIDIYANTEDYIGGTLSLEVISGYVAIAGYGYNSDNLSSVSNIFTSENDIQSDKLEISTDEMVNQVVVIGQSKSGRQIAVKATDEWSIYGGRFLPYEDLTVTPSSPVTGDISKVFNRDPNSYIEVSNGTNLMIDLPSSQIISKILTRFSNKFGERVKYRLKNGVTGKTYYDSSLRINSQEIGSVFGDESYYESFKIGLVNSVPFVGSSKMFYVYRDGEIKGYNISDFGDSSNTTIRDYAEVGEYIFVLCSNKVYRYSYSLDEVIEFSEFSAGVSTNNFGAYIVAKSTSEAYVFFGKYWSTLTRDFKLYKTNYLSTMVELPNFFNDLNRTNTTRFTTTFAIPTNKPITIVGSDIFIMFDNGMEISTGSMFTGKKIKGQFSVLRGNPSDINVVASQKLVLLSPDIYNNNLSAFNFDGNFSILFGSENESYVGIFPNLDSSGGWVFNKIPVIYNQQNITNNIYYFNNDVYFFNYARINSGRGKYRVATTLYRILSDGSISQVSSDSQVLTYQSGSTNIRFNLYSNGLSISADSTNFEETDRGYRSVDINEEVSQLVYEFEDSIGKIKLSDVQIYSRSVKNNLSLLPSSKYTFEGKTRPMYGSYDSLVGNVSDLTRPYYSYKNEELPPNYIGRVKTFVLQDGSLNNRGLCSWLAQSQLYRYRKNFFEYSATVIGNPLVEIYDCVQFANAEKNLGLATYFWVTGYNLEWNASPKLTLTVNALKPINSYQNYFNVEDEFKGTIQNFKIARINQDDVNDSEFLDGSLTKEGLQKEVFSFTDPSDGKFDPFNDEFGFGFAVTKNCKISMIITNSETGVVEKIIEEEEYKSGDVFEVFEDFININLKGSNVLSDAGDISLYLFEGNYDISISVKDIYDYNKGIQSIVVPITIEYKYNYASLINSAVYDNLTNRIKIEVQTYRKLAGTTDPFVAFDSNRAFTAYYPTLYSIDNAEIEEPLMLVDGFGWKYDNNVIQIPLTGLTIPAGRKPIIILSNVRDLADNSANELNSNNKTMPVSELFNYPFTSNPSDYVMTLWERTGHKLEGYRYYYEYALPSVRGFSPFNITTGKTENLKISITKNGAEILNGSKNTIRNQPESISYRLRSDGSGQIFYFLVNDNLSKGMRVRDLAGRVGYANSFFYNTFINTADEWLVEWYELDYYTNVTGW